MEKSAADRLKERRPAWSDDPAPEVVIRHRSGSVSSRRAYPVAHNGPFVPRRDWRRGFELIGVGEGNDVYLEPEEDAEKGSDEAKDRIKRIKNVGGGAEILVREDLEAIPPEITNKLRTLKIAGGALLQYTQNPEDLELDSTGADGFVTLPGGGIIGATRGIVHTLLQGDGGWWGTVQWVSFAGGQDWMLYFEAGILVKVDTAYGGPRMDIPGTELSPGFPSIPV